MLILWPDSVAIAWFSTTDYFARPSAKRWSSCRRCMFDACAWSTRALGTPTLGLPAARNIARTTGMVASPSDHTRRVTTRSCSSESTTRNDCNCSSKVWRWCFFSGRPCESAAATTASMSPMRRCTAACRSFTERSRTDGVASCSRRRRATRGPSPPRRLRG